MTKPKRTEKKLTAKKFDSFAEHAMAICDARERVIEAAKKFQQAWTLNECYRDSVMIPLINVVEGLQKLEEEEAK